MAGGLAAGLGRPSRQADAPCQLQKFKKNVLKTKWVVKKEKSKFNVKFEVKFNVKFAFYVAFMMKVKLNARSKSMSS